jgi:hypothetical protein
MSLLAAHHPRIGPLGGHALDDARSEPGGSSM